MKPEKQIITIRVNKDLHSWLKAQAIKEHRAMNNLLNVILTEYKEKKGVQDWKLI